MNILIFNRNGFTQRLTRQFMTRTNSLAGGTIIDDVAIAGIYDTLNKQGLLSSLRRGYSDLAGVRLNDLGGGSFGVQERVDLNNGTFGGATTSVNAVQATAANQAAWSVDADTGRRQTTYDGSNDFHSIADGAMFRAQSAGSIFIIVKDLNRAGGDSEHVATLVSRGDLATSGRASILTRNSSLSVFVAGGRRLDSDSNSTSTATSSDGYNALTNLSVWGGNTLQLVTNGTASTSATYTSGAGLSQDNDSLAVVIGAVNNGATARLNGPVAEALYFRAVLSTAQITALRNFYRRYYPTLP